MIRLYIFITISILQLSISKLNIVFKRKQIQVIKPEIFSEKKKCFLVIQKLLTKLIKIFISHNHSDRIDRRTTPVNNAVLFFECLQEGHVLRDHCHSDGASWAQMLHLLIGTPAVLTTAYTSHHLVMHVNGRNCQSTKTETKTKQRFGNKTSV